MKYRREIDGLRAVAVVPVVLFHAGFDVFSGGFVGVDVFFVISGFLITSILTHEMRDRKFSLLRFYERRARRILPALFFVGLCCIPVAWFLLLPADLIDFGQSLIAVATFSSNFLFWQESGYFAVQAELKPLLHTWSLAVEEQFYIVFPLILLALWRFGSHIVARVLIVIFVLSLLLAHWGANHEKAAAFYLLPTRAWELLVGALAAMYLHKAPANVSSSLGNILSSLGLLAISFAVILFDANTPFPSFYALVPTLGTALILVFAHQETWVGRLLSARLFVLTGLISYSIYLWHQPLFAFARHWYMGEPSQFVFWVLCVISVGLAVLSYQFIETPFRRGGLSIINRQTVIYASFLAMLTFVIVGWTLHSIQGAPWRSGGTNQNFAEYETQLQGNTGAGDECIEMPDIGVILANPKCQSKPDPKILLWGDSYAMHLYDMLQENIVARKLGVRQLALSQCFPNLLYATNGTVTSANDCLLFNSQVADHIRESNYDYVVLASPFVVFSLPYHSLSGDSVQLHPVDDLVQLLKETGAFIRSQGATPIFVAPPPTNGIDLGKCVIGAAWRGMDTSICNYPASDLNPILENVLTVMDDLSDEFTVLDFRSVLCPQGLCVASINGVPVYRDTGHFSVPGGKLVGKHFDPFGEIVLKQ